MMLPLSGASGDAQVDKLAGALGNRVARELAIACARRISNEALWNEEIRTRLVASVAQSWQA